MSELNDLYQEVILDHNRNPRNSGKLPGATCRLEGYNPLCGDRLILYLRLEGDRVVDISFEGEGCAISIASASLMTEAVKGLSRAEVEELFAAVHELLTGSSAAATHLGKVAVLSGVREYPTRIKCATLAWHTLRAAAQGEQLPVTTE